MSNFSISFCTTCMNRISHIKTTLLKNILDNLDYQGNVEFILLDYNSSDGLEKYIKTELSKFINEGKLLYYRTEDPLKYNMSHSRNMAYKLASGDIVCNIDADNFTGKGFAKYINEVFNKDGNVFLSTHNAKNVKNDVLGRICVKKIHFLNVGGYDERMKHYGFDDFDFVNRLEMSGVKRQLLDKAEFLRAISHSDEQRMVNSLSADGVRLIIGHINPAESKLFFLFKDGTCYMGTIINNRNFNALTNIPGKKRSLDYGFSIAEKSWRYGKWSLEPNVIMIRYENTKFILGRDFENQFTGSEGLRYFEISDKKTIEDLTFFLHQISNRLVMEENLGAKRYRVNKIGFGEGTVQRNFEKIIIKCL
jgi:glycosyltransferase involved in cell wall biosynthesis